MDPEEPLSLRLGHSDWRAQTDAPLASASLRAEADEHRSVGEIVLLKLVNFGRIDGEPVEPEDALALGEMIFRLDCDQAGRSMTTDVSHQQAIIATFGIEALSTGAARAIGGPCGREARALPNLRRFFEPARWRTRAMSCGFTHYALGSRSRGIGDRLTLTFSRRVSSSSLSLLDRAMNAEPAHAKPRSSARASKASNAPVLRSRSVPMMTK